MPNKNSLTPLLILAGVLALILLVGGGLFVYFNIIKPRQIDNAAPRYYTFAPSVILRSSPNSGVDFNKLGSLPYGTELITYNHGYDWSEVKVNSANIETKDLKGYISSQFILNKRDFFLLNSIFGNSDCHEVIATSKCRRALLDYFKYNNYTGRMSESETMELGLPRPSHYNQWQVYCMPNSSKTNNVYFKRLTRQDSAFTDFAVIIKNIYNGDRKILLFSFDDDETPHLVIEESAPRTGSIKSISYTAYYDEPYFYVDYTE